MSPTASSDPSESPEYLSLAKDDQHAAGMAVYRDDAFYFDLVIFKVEDCLFRVPKHEFEQQSTVFRDMFALPSVEGGENSEGTSDTDPIHLDAVSKDTFKLLLMLLYPPRSKDISPTLTFEQCESLFKASRMWDFERILLIVKNRIRNVFWDGLPRIDMIRLVHDNEIKDWYADAYYELATRREPLSIEDGQKLGLEFSIKMAQVRERMAWDRTNRKEEVGRMAIDEIFFAKEHPKPQPAESSEKQESVETAGSLFSAFGGNNTRQFALGQGGFGSWDGSGGRSSSKPRRSRRG